MAKFDAKSFNEKAFGKYMSAIPNVKLNKLRESRAIVGDARLRNTFVNNSQTGTVYAVLPFFGLLSGTPQNYDGVDNVTPDRTDTFEQGVFTYGRMNGWTEADFSYDITGGTDFMANVRSQINDYWNSVDQDVILAILKGVFGMKDTGTGDIKKSNAAFVEAHTYDIAQAGAEHTDDTMKMDATTLNSAIQKACGDNKQKFKLVYCHSAVATNLENLKLLAPEKDHKSVFAPMKYIQQGVLESKEERQKFRHAPRFAPAGQSTQMIIGATGESDYTLLQTTQQLYQGFDLKRVFYSAYIPLNEDKVLPQIGTPPPLLREHRLYQADWLLRDYGFQADELLSSDRPNFNTFIDPKCDWALRHLDQFPVEVQTASYAMLLRVPGIGPKSAGRITYARRYGRLDFASLKKMGVVLKRAQYFITCGGRQMYHTPIEEGYITRQLTGVDQKDIWKAEHANESFTQMSLADFGIG